MRKHFSLAFCLLLLEMGAAALEAMPDAKEQERLIRALSSGSFDDREIAEAAIAALGAAMLPALKDAIKSDDPEVSTRASRLLERLMKCEVEVLVQDGEGKPVCEAIVTLSVFDHPGDPRYIFLRSGRTLRAITDRQGLALFKDLPYGRKKGILWARAEGLEPAKNPEEIVSFEPQQKQRVTIVCHYLPIIEGLGEDQDGQPLAGAQVVLVPACLAVPTRKAILEAYLQNEGLGARCTLGKDGRFVLRTPHAGEYLVVMVQQEKIVARSIPITARYDRKFDLGAIQPRTAGDIPDPKAVYPNKAAPSENPEKAATK